MTACRSVYLHSLLKENHGVVGGEWPITASHAPLPLKHRWDCTSGPRSL